MSRETLLTTADRATALHRAHHTAGPSRDADADVGVLAGRTIVLDCRWLGMGGAGRITELLLADLGSSPPPGEWVLWGAPDRLGGRVFGGATIASSTSDPRAMFGQREFARVPRGDIVVYLHQIRPLRPGRSVTFILDTIPVRHGGRPAVRLAKRGFFLLVAALSTRVVTISEHSRACIAHDLRLPPRDVAVTRLPLDEERARQVADLRARLEQRPIVLYVGRFDDHKNLRSLCRAFTQTRFAALGGSLLLVGGWGREVETLRRWVTRHGLERIDLRGTCREDELDELYATSRALVLPSFDEGYGLPAFEAAASGLPVAASRTGAMTELPPDRVVLFDPRSPAEMRWAIDEAVGRPFLAPSNFVAPALASVVLDAVVRALADRRTL